MSEDNFKPVVIRSKTMSAVKKHTWTSINGYISEFTKGIEATKLDDEGVTQEQAESITNAISGLPNPWARANMFVYAMMGEEKDENTSGLFTFYGSLIDEWRGMISSFILANASDIHVKTVPLNFKDDSKMDMNNVYDAKGSFGNMLFHKKKIWEDQSTLNNADRIARPSISIIYYKSKVIGGASPESLCFTAPNYKLEGNDPFIHETTKRFVDPLKTGRLTDEQLKMLYSYVKKIRSQENLASFFNHYANSKNLMPNGVQERIARKLEDWERDILEELKNKRGLTEVEGKPEVVHFKGTPFAKVFNCENVLYIDKLGNIFDNIADAGGEYKEFKPDDLFISDTLKLAMLNLNAEKVGSLPIHAMKATSRMGNQYFTIPLSEIGFQVFEKSMYNLLNGTDQSGSSLTSSFDVDENKVNVELKLMRDGKLLTSEIRLSYNIHPKPIGSEELTVWPNFVSSYWKKYYLFSEMPHDGSDYQAFPILSDYIRNEEGTVVSTIINNSYYKQISNNVELPDDGKFVHIAENGKTKYPDLGKLIVGNIKNAPHYPYEIYESSKPFKGVQIQFRNQLSGYLFLNFDDRHGVSVKTRKDTQPPQPTQVGIDFGSNNTCVAYHDLVTGKPELLKYNNRRLNFFSSDDDHNDENKRTPAKAFEMLFFQNDPVWSNRVKSVLTLHDESRLVKDNINHDMARVLGEVVKGGVLCFEKNVAIKQSTPERHILDMAAKGTLEMAYDLKWSDSKKDDSNLKAFLSFLMLITYAELFDNDERGSLYPKQLNWAYPSAMSSGQVNHYRTNAWDELDKINPLNNEFALTIASPNLAQNKGGGFGAQNTTQTSSGGAFGQGGGAFSQGGGAFSQGGGAFGQGGGAFGQGGGAFDQSGGGDIGKISELTAEELNKLRTGQEAGYNLDNQNFNVIGTGLALTESEAVAKYASLKGNANASGKYMIGFDVGGSTTDILVLTGIPSPSGAVLQTLVKQNSIKIAAGEIARATAFVPGFGNFIKTFANNNGMQDIHAIRNLNQTTIPFCFNQVVDRLDDASALNTFYSGIAANCRPLMWLNLYVTGLNIFYAGMIARKMRAVANAGNLNLHDVTLDYFGKGARIFDWFKAVDPNNGRAFHQELFVAGYGEAEANQHLSKFTNSIFDGPQKAMNQFDNGSDNLKVEVAKGLAQPENMTKLYTLEEKVSEIIGEEGYMLRVPGEPEMIPLNSLSDASEAIIQRLGGDLQAPSEFVRFKRFLEIWWTHASGSFDLQSTPEEVINAMNSLNIRYELDNDEDFVRALQYKGASKSDYKASFFVIQAKAFMKNWLLPKMQSS